MTRSTTGDVDGMPVVLATRSAGKLNELVPMLAGLGVRVVTLADLGLAEEQAEDALEIFDTFEENALAKARYFAERTGLVVLADDSGLVVDALGGRPGVQSKRWSGRTDLTGAALDAENNALLQRALRDAASAGQSSRVARYECAAACVWPGVSTGDDAFLHEGHPRAFRGERVVRAHTAGTVLEEARGTGGFGYDPYFFSDDLGATFAEVSRDDKAGVSHRGRAFHALLLDPLVRTVMLATVSPALLRKRDANVRRIDAR
jgi:XTP/dITP diphosphohydrolase